MLSSGEPSRSGRRAAVGVAVHPGGQLSRYQGGLALGDLDGPFVAQALDLFGQHGWVSAGVAARDSSRSSGGPPNPPVSSPVTAASLSGPSARRVAPLLAAHRTAGPRRARPGRPTGPAPRPPGNRPVARAAPAGRAAGVICPLQIIDADQDGCDRGPVDQMRVQRTDPRRDRIPGVVLLRPAPGEWLAQRGQQGEERDRLAELIRCPGGQREPPALSRALSLTQQQRLAGAQFPINQQHSLSPGGGPGQECVYGLPLRRAPAHRLQSSRAHRACRGPRRPGGQLLIVAVISLAPCRAVRCAEAG